MEVFNFFESEVRSYCRHFPFVISKAIGSQLISETGEKYIDFFSGAGSLNYGHNNDKIKKFILKYIEEDGILQGLDMATVSKRNFINKFNEIILQPRNMDYKFQFTSPSGTNAVEAAIKLARKVTKRYDIVSFTNSFHGMSMGALSITGNPKKRKTVGVPVTYSNIMPYDGYFTESHKNLEYIESYLKISQTYSDLPAAIIVETIQAEGGVNIADKDWLKSIAKLAKEFKIILIIDDIQMGCGRTGDFFSFEGLELSPDIICLSKSLSGYGFPLSLVLIKPEYDIWEPGEHTGTFRGNNLAFVSGAEALNFWKNRAFTKEIFKKSNLIRERLNKIALNQRDAKLKIRGKGMIWGIEEGITNLAQEVSKFAFNNGLIIETAGINSHVIKLLPALTITENLLNEGLDILEESINLYLKQTNRIENDCN